MARFDEERNRVARKIKVRQLGRNGMEVKEVGFDEARLILEEAATLGCIVTDGKTREVIWEIGAEVEEIVILGMLGGG
jgi:trimethylamine:corrinoid methyltransferase-like protein